MRINTLKAIVLDQKKVSCRAEVKSKALDLLVNLYVPTVMTIKHDNQNKKNTGHR